MKKLLHLTVCLILIILPSGCQRADDRQAHRDQSQLDEAELLMQARRFREAKEEALTALNSLKTLVAKHPGDLDMRFLLIRAQLSVFLAENAVLIEKAPPRPRSLVRMPNPKEYQGYEDYIQPALQSLTELVSAKQDYNFEQRTFIYGNLAAIFRLTPDSTEQAYAAYQETLKAYKEWLADLKAPKSKIGSKNFAIARVKSQIRSILMAQAEVDILAEKWARALGALEEAMAGEDFEHFSTQFRILEKHIAELEDKMVDEKRWDNKNRERKLMMIINDRKAMKEGMRKQIAGYSSTKAELLITQQELSDVKNNLIYRVLCLHQLGRQKDLREARKVLRSYYPENDSQIQNLLKTSGQIK